MIVLDTNVVSALMRLEMEPVAAAWLARQNVDDLVVTSPTIFELRFGIETRPQGRRRQALEDAFIAVVVELLSNRVLGLDATGARLAAGARALHQKQGVTASIPDNQIAGIALANGCAIATGDIGDFAHLGIPLINPWTDRS